MKKKECPSCAMEVPRDAKECPICRYEFTNGSGNLKWAALLLAVFLLFYFLLF